MPERAVVTREQWQSACKDIVYPENEPVRRGDELARRRHEVIDTNEVARR
jgi:predicted dithiol-disulfide oxidoreductase (DUF899 family)